MQRHTCTLCLVALALSAAHVFASGCAGVPVAAGSCIEYSGLCKDVVGSSIFYNSSTPLDVTEAVVIGVLKTIRQNQGILSTECVAASDWYACAAIYSPCINSTDTGDEGIPLLPCDQDCSEWWASCQAGIDIYLSAVLYNDPTKSEAIMCVNGSYTQASPTNVPDVFGGRPNPLSQYYPLGYTGTLRFPLSTATYTMSNGTAVITQCYHPTRPPVSDRININVAVTCISPLVDGIDANGQPTCLLVCPVPSFDINGLERAQLAFVIPGILGFIFCLVVFVDASVTVLRSSFGPMEWNWISKSSGNEPTTSLDSSPAAPAQKRQNVKAITKYAVSGSLLGMLYFILGPLPVLVHGTQVSCGGIPFNSTGRPIADITTEHADLSDGLCRAQRVSVFILQLLFNTICFALVNMMSVVGNTFARHSKRERMTNLALSFYCFVLPIIFLIVAVYIDSPTADINVAVPFMIRQSASCSMRIQNPAAEIILIYLPFLITGLMVTGLALSTGHSIRKVLRNVETHRQTGSNDRSVHSLIMRLTVLGLGTFALLIVVVITTTVLVQEIDAYSNSFVTWVECVDTAFACNINQCAPLLALAEANKPTSALMGAQLASLACIVLLFGVFFVAQIVQRVLKQRRGPQRIQFSGQIVGVLSTQDRGTQDDSQN